MVDAEALRAFYVANRMNAKGALCVGLAITREARERGLPVAFDELLTENKGQVSSLGKSRIQKILGDYGILRVLAEEGGRTNRGNMGLAQRYLEFLNKGGYKKNDIRQIESWWVDRVRDFFAGKPLTMKFDPSRSIRSIVRDLIGVAEKRQSQNRGGKIVGAVLQHLVGAKLSLVAPSCDVSRMHGASVADDVSDRDGDFSFGDVVIHVTSAPGEAVIRKCKRNLDGGSHPILITTSKQVAAAETMAENAEIAQRLEVWDVEQFLSTNLHEHGLFKQEGRKDVARKLVEAYNAIVDACETDPSLKIELGSK